MKRPSVISIFQHSNIPIFLSAALLALHVSTSSSAPAEDAEPALYAFEEPHMGTKFRLKLYAGSEKTAREAATAAFERIGQLNRNLSDYVPDSELLRLCGSEPGKPVTISADLFSVLREALEVARETGGAFDPTIGHYTNLWRRAVRKNRLPTGEQLAGVAAKSGHEKLVLGETNDGTSHIAILEVAGMQLDLGGIAKGYAADEALKMINRFGITRAAVAAGGDIRVGDPPPGEEGWRIPVLAMDRTEESYSAEVVLANAAISTSGDREQFVEIDGVQYSHIVDPRTGLGLTRRISATVIAPSANISDSYATVLCVLGPERGLALAKNTPGIEALIVTSDSGERERRDTTEKFPAAAASKE